jgi:hypothetical protein
MACNYGALELLRSELFGIINGLEADLLTGANESNADSLYIRLQNATANGCSDSEFRNIKSKIFEIQEIISVTKISEMKKDLENMRFGDDNRMLTPILRSKVEDITRKLRQINIGDSKDVSDLYYEVSDIKMFVESHKKKASPDVTIKWLEKEVETMREAVKEFATEIQGISTRRRFVDNEEVSWSECGSGDGRDKFEIEMDKLKDFQKLKSDGSKLSRKVAEEIIPKTKKLPYSSERLHYINKLRSYKTKLESICVQKNAWSVHACKTLE